MNPKHACRACGAETEPRFEGVVLGRIPVVYHGCPACGTLQLPAPTWLDEAYAKVWDPDPDTGRAVRSLAVLRLLRRMRRSGVWRGKRKCLDVGAGNGLLVNLLREDGCEAWGEEPYSQPLMAEPFIAPVASPGPYRIVTAIEVLEHTEDPVAFVRAQAARLDARGVLVIGTELYDPARVRDPAAWHYLAAEWGQHITFPTPDGLRRIARAAGLTWWATFSWADVPCLHLLGAQPPPPHRRAHLALRQRVGERVWQRARIGAG
jgi:Methyltransferase domain